MHLFLYISSYIYLSSIVALGFVCSKAIHLLRNEEYEDEEDREYDVRLLSISSKLIVLPFIGIIVNIGILATML